MEFERRDDVTEEEYMEMIRLKTAVLLACSLKMGALIGGAPVHDAEVLYRFGIHIGLAFQLQDDMLDVYGDTSTFGKNIGGDILCDKKTSLSVLMYQLATDEQKIRIAHYRKENASAYTANEKISEITSIYDDLKLRERTQSRIKYHYDIAWSELARLSVYQERCQELLRVCSLLIDRAK